MKKHLALLLFSAIAMSCSFRGFKPAPDIASRWRLLESRDNTKTLYEYVVKMHDDFRACNLDPVGGMYDGGNPNVHSEAGGYICLEEKGYYNIKGKTCLTNGLYFDAPECVAWRKERGMTNVPRPKRIRVHSCRVVNGVVTNDCTIK